ncbi:class I SAM-dependent methyltransferase [Mucilaginibacter sp. dw_454]|uniref:class I SAM-dependent methyltransferase n=1 Tax=Mucilaginibacter sp. dw_454 TaxID=2720079 RepID=UPI001BD524EA|nr:class I SAM-dependent methyltransferase [Mucilaginibacter sp. dw_454]
MPSNYDNSAWFYDRLSKVVYGNALVNAQVYLLQFVKPNSSILIAGGGTGWILDELAKQYSSGLKITYVEISANMMALSKKRNWGNNEVTFIIGPVEEIAIGNQFDVVFTPFLFDNFREDTLQKVFDRLHQRLKPGGIWLNTDFQLTGKWWQNILLKSMFLFFRLLCRIETSVLPDINKQFKKSDYEVIAEKTFFGTFVISTALRKRD